ncbi:MAG: hypothetical protein RLZZ437_1222 [Pseudomonadota bacterium]|jgi:hypothetical protein
MTLLRHICAALTLGFFALAPVHGQAAPLPTPEGEVILDISGAIGATNHDAVAQFDIAMLDALAQRETITTTPWYDGAQTFSGPLLRDLLAAAGATGSSLRFIAINDYVVEIPMSDVMDYPVILATRHSGALMSVRDKGPLFVIYPFDEVPALFNELYFSRSAWQVRRIEVLP